MLVFQIIFTVMGAFLSVVLTKVLIQNGKIIARLEERFDQRTAEIAELVEESRKATEENSKAMAELGERFDKRTAELGERFDQRTAKIAELIGSEGEKTRKLIRNSPRNANC